MIKFDLHIHSDASKYKEAPDTVDNSNLENVDILLEKLDNSEISLFSITDHNRFNVDLYNKIDKILKSEDKKYKYIKQILAGVEFDVKLEEELEKCHIVAIFDAKNNTENYNKIKNIIEREGNIIDNISKKFYTKEEFERILKEI